MPIPVACPGCSARLNAPDVAAGKKVKCPKCQTLIVVPGGAASGAVPPAPRPAPPLRPPEPEPVGGSPFAFGGDEPAPLPTRGAKSAVPPPAFDFDGGDDAPAPRPARAAKRTPPPVAKKRPRPIDDEADDLPDDLPDDDDEDDDPPRRRKRGRPPGKKAGKPVGLIVGAAVLGLVVFAGVGIGAYYLFFDKKDDTAGGSGGGSGGGGGGSSSSSGKAAVPTGWKAFATTDGSFKAHFPGEPKEQPLPLPPQPGGKKDAITAKMYGPEPKADDALMVMAVVFQFPSAMPADAREKAMAQFATAFGGKAGGTPDAKDVTWLGQKGKESALKEPGGTGQIVIRQVVIGSKGYVGLIGAKDGRPKPEAENGFFDNFEIK